MSHSTRHNLYGLNPLHLGHMQQGPIIAFSPRLCFACSIGLALETPYKAHGSCSWPTMEKRLVLNSHWLVPCTTCNSIVYACARNRGINFTGLMMKTRCSRIRQVETLKQITPRPMSRLSMLPSPRDTCMHVQHDVVGRYLSRLQRTKP